MDRKYELIRCNKVLVRPRSVFYSTVYQVKYLKDIPKYGVKAGQLGGYVNGEHNLDQAGDCCVLNNAMVLADATVKGNCVIKDTATVRGNATVFDNATVQDRAVVANNATVYENATIRDHASITGRAMICGNATIDNAFITDRAIVNKNATIAMGAIITGRCRVSGTAVIRGEVDLGGDLVVSDNAHIEASNKYCRINRGDIGLNARIESDYDMLVIGPIGSRYAYTTFYKSHDNQIYVKCGCFNGTLENFESQVNRVHGNDEHGERYRKVIEAAKQIIVLK